MTRPSLLRTALLSSIAADLVLAALAYSEGNKLAFYGWTVATAATGLCYYIIGKLEQGGTL